MSKNQAQPDPTSKRYEGTIKEAQPNHEIIFRLWQQVSRVRRFAPDGLTIVT